MVKLKKFGLLGIFGLATLSLFILAARSQFQDDRPNDTTSAYYLSYARNLNRHPIATTRLLNIDLVGPEGSPIFGDRPAGFYRDHPPLLTWAVALALQIKIHIAADASDLLAGRAVSIIASLVTLLTTMWLCARSLGTIPAIAAGLAMLSCPVFLSHGLVVNFEPLCCALIMLGFTGGTLRFLPALLTDWPAFFALPVYSFLRRDHRRWGAVLMALATCLLTGSIILVANSVLSGDRDFFLRFVGGVVSGETRQYLIRGAGVLEEAKAVIRTMVFSNFGLLNCLIVLMGMVHWLRHLTNLSQVQKIALTSVCVTVLNVVLFHSWAAEHSFWTYYLLPAVAIAYADLLSAGTKWLRALLLVCLAASLYHSADAYLKQLLIKRPLSSAEEKCPLLLAPKSYPLFTNTRSAYIGHGYVARWYFDRPLHFVSSAHDPLIKQLCSGTPCLWLAQDQPPPLPAEQFHIQQQGSFANVFLTSFTVK